MAAAMGMRGMGMLVLGFGIIEIASALALVFGVYTQLAALVLGIIMIGAIGTKLMKWGVPFAAMDKTGWEFDLVLLFALLSILLGGGGSIGLI